MDKWITCQLHCHTLHSDGKFTVKELATSAKNIGIECVAITDHNTISGQREIPEVSKEVGIFIMPGMEWTTFNGHILLLGLEEYVEWRDLSRYDLDKGISRIHEKEALSGAPHPFRVGYPVSTGTKLMYEVKDWRNIDYIEVWSEEFPTDKSPCKMAYRHWKNLMNEGIRISAVTGRDWHRPSETNLPVPCTFVKCEKISKSNILDAIKKGKICCTYNEKIDFSIKNDNGNTYEIGDVVKGNTEKWTAKVNIEKSNYRGYLTLNDNDITVKIITDDEEKYITDVSSKGGSFEVILGRINKWAIVEIYYNIDGEGKLIGFTNAIFFDK